MKKVDIYPTIKPVMNVFPAIMGASINAEMYVGDIERCIYERAIVDEVLEDNSRVRLNLSNFDKDNSKKGESIPPTEIVPPVAPPMVEIIPPIKPEEPPVVTPDMSEEPPVVETPKEPEIVPNDKVEEIIPEQPVEEPKSDSTRGTKNKK